MDALFVVVAELLLIPLILAVLIALELTLGVAVSVVSVLLGWRSPQEAVSRTLGVVRKLALWTMLLLSVGLVVADLALFDVLVAAALDEVDAREELEELELDYGEAQGSFLLGRVELREVTLAGTQGDAADPSARFEVTVDSLVVDVAMAQLLRARLGVEELAVDGVEGSFDRLRRVEQDGGEPGGKLELSREFGVERLHVGELALTLRDHTKPAPDEAPAPAEAHAERAGEGSEGALEVAPRELVIELDELDLGPLRSETALFDLLYRSRGRGRVAGVGFTLTSDELEGVPQTTLELPELPLELLTERLADSMGVEVGGSASLQLLSRYLEDPPEPRVELALELRLAELRLGSDAEAPARTKLALAVAERGLVRLGAQFPFHVELTLLRSELEGARSLAESGILELLSDGLSAALRDELTRDAGADAERPGLLQRLRERRAGEAEPVLHPAHAD